MDKIILSFLKDLLLEMIVSFVLIVAVAFIVLKISPAYSTIQILILATYVIATFVGGYVIGKVMDKGKFMWGAISGLIYAVVIVLVSIIVNGQINSETIGIIKLVMASVGGGTLGGMVS